MSDEKIERCADEAARFREFEGELSEIMNAFCQDAGADLNEDLYNIEVLDSHNLTDAEICNQVYAREQKYKTLVDDKEREVRKELCEKYNLPYIEDRIEYGHSSDEFSWVRL